MGLKDDRQPDGDKVRPPSKVFTPADIQVDPPRAGMVVWSAVHSLADMLSPFDDPAMGYGIARNDKGYPGLWYRVEERDLQGHAWTDWQFIWTKMNSLIRTLSIVSLGNYWLDNRIWHEGSLVWERPRGVPLVPDKEGDPAHPEVGFTPGQLACGLVNVSYHIATTFPRVWFYHETGCHLLRTSFPGYQFNGDILLNFFKIGELVTATMYGVKPKLKDIQRATKELGVTHFSSQDVKQFYKVRSRDAAHDWLNVQPVERALALDCKMWSEVMVLYHWRERGVEVAKLVSTDAATDSDFIS